MSTDTIIEFKAAGKEFDSRSGTVTALADIDLKIRRGEVFGIIGYSGAGKSTLVRLVNGLEKATSGQVSVDGVDITAHSERELSPIRSNIGMIFQQFNLLRSRTIAANVAFPLKVAGWPRADRSRRVAELLDFVGLLDRAHDHPQQLSGGQKQRVGIARALATNPHVLLADEATSALDPETTTDVLNLLRRTNQELGITIVVITHEMDVIRSIADRVAVLDAGRVVELGETFDVFSNPQSRAAKRFVRSVVKTSPTAQELALLRQRHAGEFVTVEVHDSARFQQVLTELAHEGIPTTIVYGGLDLIQGREYGAVTLAVEITPAERSRALDLLQQAGRVIELIQPEDPTSVGGI